MVIDSIKICNNVRAVDFNDIVRVSERCIIDDLWEMDSLDNIKPSNKMFRRLFLYYVIKSACEFVLNYKHREKLVFIVCNEPVDLEIFEYCHDNSAMVEFINKSAKTISRNLPINFYLSDVSLESISQMDSKSGEFVSLSNTISHNVHKHRNNTFQRIKKFVRDNGLTFLSESYFKDIRTKNILFA